LKVMEFIFQLRQDRVESLFRWDGRSD
jgi:hypothetical protein